MPSSPKETSLILKGQKIARDKHDLDSHTQIRVEKSEEDIDSYELMETLGRGAFGKVSKAINTRTGTIKAVKKVKLEIKSSDEFIQKIEDLEKEATVGAHSDNYTQALLFFPKIEKKRIDAYMVSEYFPGKTIEDIIKEGKHTPQQFLIIMRGMFEEIHRLHQANIIHRDIKPANFIVSKNLVVKAVDYGLSEIQGKKDNAEIKIEKKLGGTAFYAPFEAFFGISTQAGDIYAAGVSALEILHQGQEEKLCINGKDTGIPRLEPGENLANGLAKSCPNLNSKQCKLLADIIKKMTKTKLNQRLDTTEYAEMLATYDREILKIPPVSQVIKNVDKLLNNVISMLERRALKASPIERKAIEETLGETNFTPEQLKNPKNLYALREKIATASDKNRKDFTFMRQLMGEFNNIAKDRLNGNKFTNECNSGLEAIKKLVNHILPFAPWRNLSVAGSAAAAREEVEQQYQTNFRSVK